MTTKFITSRKYVVFAALMLSGQAFAGQGQIDRIENALGEMDIPALKQMSNEFTGYDYALVQYRLAIASNTLTQRDKAIQAIDKSIDTLTQLDATTPDNVEVKALLAQAYGYKISLNPETSMTLGMKLQRTIIQAETLEPGNPRLLLVKGTSAMFTPAVFGGSTELAIAALNKAIEAYKTDYTSGYHWGYAEAYTWKGYIEHKQGNIAQARADWQQALAIDADYGWALSLLESI